MAVKFRINIMESERGWGSDRWTEDFDSYKAAKDRIIDINSKNTSNIVPDWYMIADTIINVVEV